MANSNVDPKAMRNAADRMDASVAYISRRKGDIEAEIQGMMVSFTGEAATTYQGAMQGWYNNVDVITSKLGHMAIYMRNSAAAYESGNAQAVDTARQSSRQVPSVPATPGLPGV